MKKNNAKSFLIDFLQKLMLAAWLIYFLFFCAETILPGLIINAFNFNWLLVMALVLLALVIILKNRSGGNAKLSGSDLVNKKRPIFLGGLFLLGLSTAFIALYRISIWQRLIYLVLAGLIFYFLWQLVRDLRED